MSVYKPGRSQVYHFDFQHRGRRFYGSTGQTRREKAEQVEKAERQKVALATARGDYDKATGPDIPTLAEAAAEWWDFKGKALGRPEDVDARETRLMDAVLFVGPDKLVNDIGAGDIAQAIAKRRGRLVRGPGGTKKVAAPATINRDVVCVIRPILRRQRKLLNDKPGVSVPFPEIDWAELTLAEPKPKPRDFAADAMDAIIAALPVWWRDFARFEARYGVRLEEMFFRPSTIDVPGRRVRLQDRKGDDDHILTLLEEDAATLAARKGRAEAAKLGTVWFRELKSGKLKALTYGGALQALRTAMREAGVHASQGAKGSHDFRRHAAMVFLRKTGNLRLTQKLLGHANIQSTLVYAHAMEDDLRAGMEAVYGAPVVASPEISHSQEDGEVKPPMKSAG